MFQNNSGFQSVACFFFWIALYTFTAPCSLSFRGIEPNILKVFVSKIGNSIAVLKLLSKNFSEPKIIFTILSLAFPIAKMML